jgi:hypothetical protein
VGLLERVGLDHSLINERRQWITPDVI